MAETTPVSDSITVLSQLNFGGAILTGSKNLCNERITLEQSEVSLFQFL
jgi:hypothetical protein